MSIQTGKSDLCCGGPSAYHCAGDTPLGTSVGSTGTVWWSVGMMDGGIGVTVMVGIGWSVIASTARCDWSSCWAG